MKVISSVTKQMEKELKKHSNIDYPAQAICSLIINRNKYKAIAEYLPIMNKREIIGQRFRYCIHDFVIDDKSYKRFNNRPNIEINGRRYYSTIKIVMFWDDLKKKNHRIATGSLYFIEY